MQTEHPPSPTQSLLLAALPGALVLLVWQGPGLLLNLLAVGAGTAAALSMLPGDGPRSAAARWQQVRGRHGAWIATLLLGISLPPAVPVWVGAAGGVVAVLAASIPRSAGIALNPAMLGYIVLLLAFPIAMSGWPIAGAAATELGDSLRSALGMLPADRLDALSGATALGQLRSDTARTVAELRAGNPAFGAWGARGIEWANAAFLAGGLWLAWRRVIAWRLPAATIGTIAVLALLGNDGGGSASRGPALFHLFSGGTMLGAFFVLTEPRGAPRTPTGQWLGGALAGALVYAIRTSGAWPDGIAFAALAVNALLPVLDGPQPARPSSPEGYRRTAVHLGRALVLLLVLSAIWREPTAPREPELDPGAWLQSLETLEGAEIRAFRVQDPMRLGLGEADTAYRAIRAGRAIGLLLPVVAPQGYGGPIRLWLALDASGKVLGVRVRAHRESAAFAGAPLSAGSAWLAAFEGRALENTRWQLRAEGGSFDAFTGASITPRAVVAGLEGALQYFRENREALLDPER